MQPQLEKIKNQQKTTINQSKPHGETTKQEQIQTQDKRIQETTKPYRRVVRPTGPNWYQVVLDVKISNLK